MSVLAIDIGNSRIKAALFDGDRIVDRWWSKTPDVASGTPGGVLADHLAPVAGDTARPTAVTLASVVPAVTPLVESAVVELLGIEPVTIDAEVLASVMRLDVERPPAVGTDRLLNALAVHARFPGPGIAVDVGTAATFDVVGHDGAYLGGAIAPGPGIAAEALHRMTAQLPAIELRRPARAIGRDTVSAMQSGVVNGYIGLVSGLLTALRAELVERSPDGSRPTVVMTGGHADAPWLSALPGIDVIDPDLTLRGLRAAHERLSTAAGVAR